MVNLNQPLPGYLTSKANIIRLVGFTALFALVFINIYAPFGVETWYNVTRLELFVYSSLVILTGVLVVVVSRIILYFVSNRVQLTVFQYLVWILGEVFLMALFYTLYEKLILSDNRPLETVFGNSVQNTALVLFLPYSVLWLYFSYVDKKGQIEALRENTGSAFDFKSPMVGFPDEKGVLQLSLLSADILFIEASSNYVVVAYVKKDKVSRFLLRNTMKKLEPELVDYGIIRCHRSFMVNVDRVRLMRKDKTGLVLELDSPENLEIPVTKTYLDALLKIFGQHVGL
ncbi:MAG: LytTR family DNA-binding domain-containing protein [Bacteroidales bacterium]|nr:LytTR family DNA-binding domain-containing protein [Bacteroidales bacterium]MDD3665537.1 LytTR family DNA-binding domain-containing protein [Bacteroidales bacterium]